MQNCSYSLVHQLPTLLQLRNCTGWWTSRLQNPGVSPYFSCPASKLNSTGDQKQAWGAWEGWKHPCGTPDPSTWQRSAKMNQSYLRLEGGCADSAIPVWNSSMGKRGAGLLYGHIWRVSPCARVGRKEPLQYVAEIYPAFRAGFQWNGVCSIKVAVADSLSRGKRTSQTALSQPPEGLSWGTGVSASVHAEVWSLYCWPVAPLPQVSILLCCSISHICTVTFTTYWREFTLFKTKAAIENITLLLQTTSDKIKIPAGFRSALHNLCPAER